MSTATIDKKQSGQQNGQQGSQSTSLANIDERSVTYTPVGEKDSIVLSVAQIEKFLCVKTKSGKIACREDIVKFMMLCKAQGLNPWVNDAYLVGYDTQDGPKFSLITAHQSLLKRSELSHGFDGMASGVCVMSSDGQLHERQGDLVLKGETLVGGWARVHRRDRSVPSYDCLKLDTFSTGKSRWAADPAGMIVKCAEASALRKAFPSTLSQMYCREEMERQIEYGDRERTKPVAIASLVDKQPPRTVETTRTETVEPRNEQQSENVTQADVSQLQSCRDWLDGNKFETAMCNPEGNAIRATLADGSILFVGDTDMETLAAGDHFVSAWESDAVQQVKNIVERASKKTK